MNKIKRVILVSGASRAGKDTFAAALKKELRSRGKTVKILSFAHVLKQECAAEIREKYNLDSFSDSLRFRSSIACLCFASNFAKALS